MLLQNLAPKKVLEIKKENGHRYYSSPIQEVRDDRILIDFPCRTGRPLLSLNPGDRINARFTEKSGCYSFISWVISVNPNDSTPGYAISIPHDWKCVQRREMFRLDVVFDVKCFRHGTQHFYAQALDLSGSGMRIVSKRKLEVGEGIRLELLLFDEVFNINAEVKWVKQKELENEVLYFTGLCFIDLSWKTQDAIVAAIFKMQVGRNR
ncbi:MAG: flagellar brake protein [Bacillota bacterium]|jgi:c-di-GMP-binding flagellar brake protein YcgR